MQIRTLTSLILTCLLASSVSFAGGKARKPPAAAPKFMQRLHAEALHSWANGGNDLAQTFLENHRTEVLSALTSGSLSIESLLNARLDLVIREPLIHVAREAPSEVPNEAELSNRWYYVLEVGDDPQGWFFFRRRDLRLSSEATVPLSQSLPVGFTRSFRRFTEDQGRTELITVTGTLGTQH